MRKEVIFAIAIGLLLGGVILYGAQLANSSAKKAASVSPTPIDDSNTPEITPTPAGGISIAAPLDHSVSSDTLVKVTGSAKPNTRVIIFDDDDQLIATADATGKFSGQIKVSGGMNQITAGSLLDNNLTSTTVSLAYTTAKLLTPTPNPVDAPIASASDEIVTKTKEDILRKAQDRYKETEEGLAAKAENLLVAYFGTINNITQNALTLADEKINLQVSLSTSSAVLKNGKSIKPDQLSIKDKIIVFGTQGSNDIIDAKRIVVDAGTTSTVAKKLIYAPITKVNAKSQSLAVSSDNQNLVLVAGKKTQLDFTKITAGQKLFALLQPDEDPSQPSTILLAAIF